MIAPAKAESAAEKVESTDAPDWSPVSVITPPEPARTPTAALPRPKMSSTPPLTVSAPLKPVSPPRAVALPRRRVPALTVVPPVWKLAPDRVWMPRPALTTARLPRSWPA